MHNVGPSSEILNLLWFFHYTVFGMKRPFCSRVLKWVNKTKHMPNCGHSLVTSKIDWLTALRHISTERLLVPIRNVASLNKIWSSFADKCNCVWRNADWPASWPISTKNYQWQWKCGCSLTSLSKTPLARCAVTGTMWQPNNWTAVYCCLVI